MPSDETVDDAGDVTEGRDSVKAYLRVFNSSGEQVYAETEPFVLTPGHAEYLEIILDDSITPRRPPSP